MKSWNLDFSSDESPAGNNLIAICVKVTLENMNMPDILEIDGLFEAIQSEGKKPVFTCGCGNFGCGGYYIEVIHTQDGVRLINGYEPLNQDILKHKFEKYLSWKDIYMILDEVLAYLSELGKKHRGYEFCSGTYGPNLLEEIDSYYCVLESVKNKIKF